MSWREVFLQPEKVREGDEVKDLGDRWRTVQEANLIRVLGADLELVTLLLAPANHEAVLAGPDPERVVIWPHGGGVAVRIET